MQVRKELISRILAATDELEELLVILKKEFESKSCLENREMDYNPYGEKRLYYTDYVKIDTDTREILVRLDVLKDRI